MTLAGLVLFLGGSLLATRLFLAADNDPALSARPDPVMVAGSEIGTVGMGLLCIGFVAWSAAVFLKKK